MVVSKCTQRGRHLIVKIDGENLPKIVERQVILMLAGGNDFEDIEQKRPLERVLAAEPAGVRAARAAQAPEVDALRVVGPARNEPKASGGSRRALLAR